MGWQKVEREWEEWVGADIVRVNMIITLIIVVIMSQNCRKNLHGESTEIPFYPD